jgi:hypothetical protein
MARGRARRRWGSRLSREAIRRSSVNWSQDRSPSAEPEILAFLLTPSFPRSRGAAGAGRRPWSCGNAAAGAPPSSSRWRPSRDRRLSVSSSAPAFPRPIEHTGILKASAAPPPSRKRIPLTSAFTLRPVPRWTTSMATNQPRDVRREWRHTDGVRRLTRWPGFPLQSSRIGVGASDKVRCQRVELERRRVALPA